MSPRPVMSKRRGTRPVLSTSGTSRPSRRRFRAGSRDRRRTPRCQQSKADTCVLGPPVDNGQSASGVLRVQSVRPRPRLRPTTLRRPAGRGISPWASAAGQNCGHVLGAEAPGRQGATRAHSRSYVTEEQRSRPGWIGSQNMADILTGGTRAFCHAPRGFASLAAGLRTCALPATLAVSRSTFGPARRNQVRLSAAVACSPAATADAA